MTEQSGFIPIDVPEPDESFVAGGKATDLTVRDFWAWILGDLRMNTTRGVLVEFLVAKAVGDDSSFRTEWGPWDVKADDGTLIEIKTSGYSQSWDGADSNPRFEFRAVNADQTWNEEAGRYVDVDPDRRVHVWIFAVHMTRRSEAYDPLDLDSFSFYVVPHIWLRRRGTKSMSLSVLEKTEFEPVGWNGLREAVRAARVQNDRLLEDSNPTA